MASVTVHFGRLRRIIGRAVRHEDFAFVGALAELDNEPEIDWHKRCELTPDYPLAAFTPDDVPESLAACDVSGYGFLQDAMWVRARIPAVFDFAPVSVVEFACKYALLEQAFVACEPSGTSGDWDAYPFVCLEYNLCAGLRFSPEGPPAELRERIAHAFWGLLLQNPDDLHPFRDGYLSCDPDMYDEWWQEVEFEHGKYNLDGVVLDQAEDDEPG